MADSGWSQSADGGIAEITDLGPLLELSRLYRAKGISQSTLERTVRRTRTLEAIIAGQNSGAHYWLDGQGRSVGIMMCESKVSANGEMTRRGISEPTDECLNRWDKFANRLEISAQQCGLSRRMAQGIAGVLQELQDNIFEHSYLADSGTLGFRHTGKTIEIIAADSGVGIWESFRRVSTTPFESHEEALRAVVYEHRSRFDSKEGHGNGLRQIFGQLATLRGNLRFRTGDISLNISGNNFTIDNIVEVDEPFLPGFLVYFAISPRGLE